MCGDKMNDENMIENTEQVFYAVSVNGNICSPKYATPAGAESQISLLSEAHQAIAEVVPVTSEGKQLLFG